MNRELSLQNIKNQIKDLKSDTSLDALDKYYYLVHILLQRVIDAEKVIDKVNSSNGKLEAVYYWAKWENIDEYGESLDNR